MIGGRALRAFGRSILHDDEQTVEAEVGGILVAQVIADIRAIVEAFSK